MGTTTGIEWTDATWNPVRGCTPVSPGCKNCYAAKVAKRFSFAGGPYEGLVRINAAGERTDDWNGQIKFVDAHLLDPLKWKAGRRIFVNSMSDLFHENVTDEMRDRIFDVMQDCPQHTFQILTKRQEAMLRYVNYRQALCREIREHADDDDREMASSFVWPLPNVWLGVSVENQKAADERIPLLLQTPAAVRFISAEPLLGPVNLMNLPLGSTSLMGFGFVDALRGWQSDRANKCGPGQQGTHLDWVICGGESGPGARPMHPDWARSLRDQCASAGVAFFFKQWGQWVPTTDPAVAAARGIPLEECMSYVRDKHAAGALLDGVEHKAFPAVRA